MIEAYRLSSSRYPPNSGKGAALHGGRWNNPGAEVIYAAESRSLAAIEVLVHFAVLPRNFVITPIEIPDVVSIETLSEIVARRLIIEQRTRQNLLRTAKTRAIGDRWITTGRNAVLSVPSVIIPQECNYVLNVAHPDFSHIKFLPSKPFWFDPRLKDGGVPVDQRSYRRYPLALEMQYKLPYKGRVKRLGRGRTVNVSRGGVLFKTNEPLPIGVSIELMLDWPVQLDGIIPLQMMVLGSVIRSDSNGIAIRKKRHEFRTTGRSYGRRSRDVLSGI